MDRAKMFILDVKFVKKEDFCPAYIIFLYYTQIHEHEHSYLVTCSEMNAII